MAFFEAACTDMKVVHMEDDRQRLKQFDVALQTMATQATRSSGWQRRSSARHWRVRARCDGGEAYHKRPA